jgi:hypothetical protein
MTLQISLSAQTSAAFCEAGDAAMSKKDYQTALQYYVEAGEAGTASTELLWKTAEAARQSASFSLALKMYGKVIDSKQHQSYSLAKFWFACMSKNLGKYKDAKDGFLQFLKMNGVPEEYRILAKAELKLCDWALKISSVPTDVTIEHLGKNINSPYSEFGAFPRNDTLLFSALRFENKDDNQVPPRLITRMLASAGTDAAHPMYGFNAENQHTASIAFSPGAQKVVYCICEYPDNTAQIRCDLYSRVRKGNGWTRPKKLPDHINLPKTSTTQPSLGMDEKGNEVLYFVSDRKEGKGKHDIWYSFVLADDQYSAPVNLASINTKGDEMTPYYFSQNSTLYFSSDGYETMGGLDIFASVKKGSSYSAPRHMGTPLNSSCNDFYFYVMPNGKEAYFSSNRIGSLFLDAKNETCCYDIYKANFPPELLQPTPKDSVISAIAEISPKSNKPSDKPATKVERKSNIPTAVVEVKEDSSKLPSEKKNEQQKAEREAMKNSAVVSDKALEKPRELSASKATDNERVNTDASQPVSVTMKGQEFKEDSVAQKQIAVPSAKSDGSADLPKQKSYRKSALDAYLPLPLYFDNDEPDNNTTSITTKKSYEETFLEYYSRKLEYMEKSGKGLPPLKKIQTETDMMLFFEQTIKPNFAKLREFTPVLLYRLQQGDQYEIILKGFASPLAKNQYNNNLGKRRVQSLYNFWNTYEKNVFEKYFDNGQLKITLRSFGEETAAKNISDDEHNEAGSIYNIRAAKERRIEIIEVKGDEK